ncbi:MAG: bifunctional phosphoribosylaminoimidazolecarboxamide formyltransferase/IMP cyclohydrolase [Gemmatimonadetes bacterium]|nr:bifunctional phosphoribosylaminoimidazolecarboxamide formyltransferase/IMP cyclohydrolase [Gemmatimonadota bacterium]
MPLRVAVCVSGRGSNLRSLVDELSADRAAEVVLVISNRADAGAIAFAHAAGIPTAILGDPDDPAEWLRILAAAAPELVVLAGFLKRVPPAVVTAYRGRIINIHPALLPKFGGPGMYGIRVHRAVLAAGERESGATVHVVTAEYDEGPILAQGKVPVLAGDTPETLAARVLAVEHRLLPAAVRVAAAAGQLTPFTFDAVGAMKRALISVSDKRGIVEFAKGLVDLGFELVSTGGTAATLAKAGLAVTAVDDVTGFPEMLDGRVKTLHPRIHAGLLAQHDNEAHTSTLAQHGIKRFDLVAVNLYPFQATVSAPDVTFENAIENIDVGGPSMLRAAAKNHQFVLPVVDPTDYPRVLELFREGTIAPAIRRDFAAKVFSHTSDYDTAIAGYLTVRNDSLPPRLNLSVEKLLELRYGENPDQRAALYASEEPRGIRDLKQRQGKELSFNNLLDIDAATSAVAVWKNRPACCIVKHTTPCGIAVGQTALEALEKARATDPLSAFGGVIACNTVIDRAIAEALRDLFFEVIVAPSVHEDALEVFTEKKNLRVVELPIGTPAAALDWKRVRGGFLVQDRFGFDPSEAGWTVPTSRKPTTEELNELRFAWAAVTTVKSNAILLARDEQAIGIGAGQMSRVDAVFLAIHKARQQGHALAGSVLASDGFFPFPDGVEEAAQAGVTGIIQPGGSVRDAEVIAAANRLGIAMVVTGRRMFRH